MFFVIDGSSFFGCLDVVGNVLSFNGLFKCFDEFYGKIILFYNVFYVFFFWEFFSYFMWG